MDRKDCHDPSLGLADRAKVVFLEHNISQNEIAMCEAAGCAAACGVLRGPNLLQVQAPQHAILLHPGVAHAAGMQAAARIEAQRHRQQECHPQSSNEP